MALALPTARVSRCVPPAPGMMPSVISGWPNTALSAAMMMSQAHGELAAAAERISGDRRDDRLAAMADAVEGGEEIAAIGLDEGLGLHLLDVDAGGERLLVAGDDDAADRGVGLEGVERAVELADKLRR